MSIEWLPIFLSALSSGLLSLVISHIYYRISLSSAERHHIAQMQSTAKRHAEQMERMTSHHAEQLLVLRTTLLAVEKDSGLEAARDEEMCIRDSLICGCPICGESCRVASS